MTIPAKKLTVNLYLISTVLWGFLTISAFFGDSRFRNLLIPIYIFLTIIWGFLYWYYRKGVIKIENGTIAVNGIFTDRFSFPKWKKFNLNEVSIIKKTKGDYVFTSKEGQVKLATSFLDKNYIPILKEELSKYNIELG